MYIYEPWPRRWSSRASNFANISCEEDIGLATFVDTFQWSRWQETVSKPTFDRYIEIILANLGFMLFAMKIFDKGR